MFEPKRAEELCVITLENDAKFQEEMTCALKNDMRNLANFDLTLESLKICSLMGSFWFKVFLKCRYSYPFGLRYSLYLICIVSPYPSPPGKSFLPESRSFALLPGRATSKTPPSFLLTSLFLGYSNSQARINKMGNILNHHPCP